MTYDEFLKTKELSTIEAGIDIPREQLNPALFDFQKDIVKWALLKGKAAIFSDTGTGKSFMQMEYAHQIVNHTGCRALIIAPLAVARQTQSEGAKFGIKSNVVRHQRDVKDGVSITNYEILDHFDTDTFDCVVLDESSILKSFTSATRNELIDRFQKTKYRLCCTATPSPNDHTELGNHAEFLGIMSRTEMLATYFIHDGSDTSKWRLKGYGEKRFWEWAATWAVCVRNPQDLGYDIADYKLPDLNIIEHVCESQAGEYELFAKRAESLSERRAARKESMNDRIKKTAELVGTDNSSWIVWCDFNDESHALHSALSGSVEVVGSDDPDYKAQTAIDFSQDKIHILVSKPSIYGFGMNFQNCHNMIFCGISDSYEQFYQSIRRCYRYGQKHPVNIHIITSEKELNVLDNIKKKHEQLSDLQNNMVSLMRDVTMSEINHTTRITTEYKPEKEMRVAKWIS